MIVKNVLSQGFGYSSVSFVGVHNCRKNVLLTADDLHGCLIRILIELLSKFISAVIVEVS
ncbi:hypothetical protein SDC9_191567 [bioreactor metagenome]|uniref:Uncharacterized protein n=1 Tax=bioreactor metagenome TaxID=1076179 RepID=A0A645HZI5_9ZZZZ